MKTPERTVLACATAFFCMPGLWLATCARADDAPLTQSVSLPYTFHDDPGTQWDVGPDGSIGPGMADVFDAGGRLYLDQSSQYAPNIQQGKLNARRSELVLPDAQVAGFTVSRRVAVNVAAGWCRWVELIENHDTAPKHTLVRVNFDLGASNQSQQPIADPKDKNKTIGASFFDGNRGISFLYGGSGVANMPTMTSSNGSDQIDFVYDLRIPARQSICIVHFAAVRGTIDEAQAVFEQAAPQSLTGDLPHDLRRRVVNFPRPPNTLDDFELLRDDLLDVVELRSGDQLKGTLTDRQFTVHAPYGLVKRPSEKMVAILAVGSARPDYLLVCEDGQAFAGQFEGNLIHLQLASGQMTAVPLRSVQRVGWRRRNGEPEEWVFRRPLLQLRSGDRLEVDAPAAPLTMITRLGTLQLQPGWIGSIDFAPADSALHEVELVDGSRLTGLVAGKTFSFNLSSLGSQNLIELPMTALARLRMSPKPDPDGSASQPTTQPAAEPPMLRIGGADILNGVITGTLTLETGFDSLRLDAAEVRMIRRTSEHALDVQVTVWDGSTVSGKLSGDAIVCRLQCGMEIGVPLPLVQEYTQPYPRPPAKILDEIRSLVNTLHASDAASRDRATTTLKKMGPAIGGALRLLRQDGPKEIQARVDEILAAIQLVPAAPSAPPPVRRTEQENVPADAPNPPTP